MFLSVRKTCSHTIDVNSLLTGGCFTAKEKLNLSYKPTALLGQTEQSSKVKVSRMKCVVSLQHYVKKRKDGKRKLNMKAINDCNHFFGKVLLVLPFVCFKGFLQKWLSQLFPFFQTLCWAKISKCWLELHSHCTDIRVLAERDISQTCQNYSFER